MDPVTIGLLAAGLLMSAGGMGLGIWHAEDLTARSQRAASAEAKAAEERSMKYAAEAEARANAQLQAAMKRPNPYGSNMSGRLEENE